MKKVIVLLSVLLAFSTLPVISQKTPPPTQKKETIVYVCDSKTSYAYHTASTCSGLNRCTHTIIKMTEPDAKKDKRTPCKKCH
jgi:hypothetical protein